MRVVDAYWMETKQRRTAKTPDLTETIILSDAAEECRLRTVYVPMTAEEYDPEADSLNVTSAPAAGGAAAIRYVTFGGTRYMERTYAENNPVGCVKTLWIMKTQGEAVTDMVREMSTAVIHPGPVVLTFQKPVWYDQDKDKLELYYTDDTGKPKDQWTSADSEITSVTLDGDTIRIGVSVGHPETYGLWLYHSTGGKDLRNAVITESVKTATVGSTVQFFPMPALGAFDKSRDLLWIFAGGSQRSDFTIESAAYEDGGTADFLQFAYGIGGAAEFRYYQSTADPPADVRGYTPEQVEAGLRAYEIVTEETVRFIDAGYLQVGDATERKQITMQQYTMADGTICVYPAQKAVARMTLELECTELQAHHLEEALCHMPLLLTGVKHGAADAGFYDYYIYPSGIGRLYILDGEAEIGEKYAGSGIYSVRLPLIVQTGEEGTRMCRTPDIRLYFDGSDTPETSSAYTYVPKTRVHDYGRNIVPSGLFVRKEVYYTASDTFTMKFMPSALYPYTLNNVLYQENTMVAHNLEPDTEQEFTLRQGENVFTFYFSNNQDKSRCEDYRLTVYRQVRA